MSEEPDIMLAVFSAADAAQDATDSQGFVPPNWTDRAVACVAEFLRKASEIADGLHLSFPGGEVWTGSFCDLADAIESRHKNAE